MSETLQKFKCAIIGHNVSEWAEEELFKQPKNILGSKRLNCKCQRCGAPLVLEVSPDLKEDEYYMCE